MRLRLPPVQAKFNRDEFLVMHMSVNIILVYVLYNVTMCNNRNFITTNKF